MRESSPSPLNGDFFFFLARAGDERGEDNIKGAV